MNEPNAHPLLSSGFLNYLRLLYAYGFDASRLPRVLGLGLATLLREPVSLVAAVRYHRRVARQKVEPDPLFLIGHWRSGTTHLQNVLNRDPRLGRVTLLQAAMPREYLLLTAGMKRRVGRLLPSTRLMDNVPVAADVPWEEELALTAVSRYSFYHVSFFPRCMERIFDESVMLDTGREEAIRKWEVIIGYVPAKDGISSLLVAAQREGALRYIAEVSVGLTAQDQTDLARTLPQWVCSAPVVCVPFRAVPLLAAERAIGTSDSSTILRPPS